MPARYFFHAPDGRIYGPASAETLRRWEAEGRLRPDSRLRAEGVDDLFHAWSELRDRKEEPEAVPAVASTASAASEKPPVIPPATPFVPLLVPAAPLSEVVAEAFSLTQRAWRPLWFLVLLFQVPGIVFAALAEPVFHATVDPATGALRMNGAGYGAACLLLLILFLCVAFLVLPLRDLREGRPVSLARTWSEFAPQAGGLLWTYFLTFCILAAWGMLTMLLGVAAFFVHGLVRGLVAVTAVVSAVPTLLLALRCLVLPQAALLERRSGLSALRRAIEVIRFSPRNSLFSASDLRALVLALLASGAVPVALYSLCRIVQALPLPGHLSLALAGALNLFGSVAATLFFVSVFLVFFEDARRRFRAAGGEWTL